MKNSNTRQDVKEMQFHELETFVQELDIQKFKAKIIWQWLYTHFASSFEQMTNLSKADREVLHKFAQINVHELVSEHASVQDGTEKYVLRLADGKLIETVFLPADDHNTLCISSQVGCPQKCGFCATGVNGFKRNLTAAEIVEQVLFVRRRGHDVDNIVFMGMGEPLLNFDAVVAAIRILNGSEGLGIGARKITVSTSGIVTNIMKLADLELGVNLAISLNATSNHVRTKLMPVNAKNPVMKLIEAAQYMQGRSGRRITFEYVLLDGINDSEKDAKDLCKLMKMLISHVNLINYNASDIISDGYRTSTRLPAFRKILIQNEISVTARNSMGSDIAAACGQLAG